MLAGRSYKVATEAGGDQILIYFINTHIMLGGQLNLPLPSGGH